MQCPKEAHGRPISLRGVPEVRGRLTKSRHMRSHQLAGVFNILANLSTALLSQGPYQLEEAGWCKEIVFISFITECEKTQTSIRTMKHLFSEAVSQSVVVSATEDIFRARTWPVLKQSTLFLKACTAQLPGLPGCLFWESPPKNWLPPPQILPSKVPLFMQIMIFKRVPPMYPTPPPPPKKRQKKI